MLSKNAIGNLINRYKAVLKKCHLLNTFGSLAVAGMLVMGGGVSSVGAEQLPTLGSVDIQNKVRTEIKALGPVVTQFTDQNALDNYVNALDIAPAYAVEIVDSSKQYYITFTVPEIQQNGTSVNKTYGIQLINPTTAEPTLVDSIKDVIARTGSSYQINSTGSGTPGFTQAGIPYTLTARDGTPLISTETRFDIEIEAGESYNGNIILSSRGITVEGDANSITGSFVGNDAISVIHLGGYDESTTLKSVKADFIGNIGRGIRLLSNYSIDLVEGDFIGNETGIELERGTTSIGVIKGDFLANRLYAIRNNGGTIGAIVGDFVGNSRESAVGQSSGVVLDIRNGGVIHSITGDFIGNVGGNTIFLDDTYEPDGRIGTITGDFINNLSEDRGGAISAYGDISSITGNFIGNASNKDGGAIYINLGDTIGLLDGNFINNTSTGEPAIRRGAAIYNDGIITKLTGDFIGNVGEESGALANMNVDADIGEITGNFMNNKATDAKGLGGAILNSRGDIGTITGNFMANEAGDDGGAIFNERNIDYITGNFSNNEAGGDGGAIFNDLGGSHLGGALAGITGNFEGNTSGGLGGAIYTRGVIQNLSGSFLNNSAATGGGAIYTERDLVFTADGQDYTISGNTVGSGATQEYNAILFDTVYAQNTRAVTFNLHNSGTYTLNDSAVVKITETQLTEDVDFRVMGNGAGENVFNLNNNLVDFATVTVQDATLALGSYTHTNNEVVTASLGTATLRLQNNAILKGNLASAPIAVSNVTNVATGDSATLAGKLNFSNTVTADGSLKIDGTITSTGAITVNEGGSLTVTSGMLDISSGVFNVNTKASVFTVGEDGTLKAAGDSFGDFDFANGTFTQNGTVLKALDNDGVLIITGENYAGTVTRENYEKLLADFDLLMGDGTVSFFGINVETRFLNEVITAQNTPTETLSAGTTVAQGTYSFNGNSTIAGITKEEGSTHGATIAAGTLTLTGKKGEDPIAGSVPMSAVDVTVNNGATLVLGSAVAGQALEASYFDGGLTIGSGTGQGMVVVSGTNVLMRGGYKYINFNGGILKIDDGAVLSGLVLREFGKNDGDQINIAGYLNTPEASFKGDDFHAGTEGASKKITFTKSGATLGLSNTVTLTGGSYNLSGDANNKIRASDLRLNTAGSILQKGTIELSGSNPGQISGSQRLVLQAGTLDVANASNLRFISGKYSIGENAGIDVIKGTVTVGDANADVDFTAVAGRFTMGADGKMVINTTGVVDLTGSSVSQTNIAAGADFDLQKGTLKIDVAEFGSFTNAGGVGVFTIDDTFAADVNGASGVLTLMGTGEATEITSSLLAQYQNSANTAFNTLGFTGTVDLSSLYTAVTPSLDSITAGTNTPNTLFSTGTVEADAIFDITGSATIAGIKGEGATPQAAIIREGSLSLTGNPETAGGERILSSVDMTVEQGASLYLGRNGGSETEGGVLKGITMTGGDVYVAGTTVTSNGGVTFGDLTANATFRVDSDRTYYHKTADGSALADLTVAGSNNFTATFNNEGAAHMAALTVEDDGRFTNGSIDTLNATHISITAGGDFENTGAVEATSLSMGGASGNEATFDMDRGSVELSGAVTLGEYAKLTINGGNFKAASLDLNDHFALSIGAGKSMEVVTADFADVFSLRSGGTLKVTGDAPVTVAAGGLTVSGNTTLESKAGVTGGNLTLGAEGGAGNYTLTDGGSWTTTASQIITVERGTLTIGSGATLDVSANAAGLKVWAGSDLVDFTKGALTVDLANVGSVAGNVFTASDTHIAEGSVADGGTLTIDNATQLSFADDASYQAFIDSVKASIFGYSDVDTFDGTVSFSNFEITGDPTSLGSVDQEWNKPTGTLAGGTLTYDGETVIAAVTGNASSIVTGSDVNLTLTGLDVNGGTTNTTLASADMTVSAGGSLTLGVANSPDNLYFNGDITVNGATLTAFGTDEKAITLGLGSDATSDIALSNNAVLNVTGVNLHTNAISLDATSQVNVGLGNADTYASVAGNKDYNVDQFSATAAAGKIAVGNSGHFAVKGVVRLNGGGDFAIAESGIISGVGLILDKDTTITSGSFVLQNDLATTPDSYSGRIGGAILTLDNAQSEIVIDTAKATTSHDLIINKGTLNIGSNDKLTTSGKLTFGSGGVLKIAESGTLDIGGDILTANVKDFGTVSIEGGVATFTEGGTVEGTLVGDVGTDLVLKTGLSTTTLITNYDAFIASLETAIFGADYGGDLSIDGYVQYRTLSGITTATHEPDTLIVQGKYDTAANSTFAGIIADTVSATATPAEIANGMLSLTGDVEVDGERILSAVDVKVSGGTLRLGFDNGAAAGGEPVATAGGTIKGDLTVDGASAVARSDGYDVIVTGETIINNGGTVFVAEDSTFESVGGITVDGNGSLFQTKANVETASLVMSDGAALDIAADKTMTVKSAVALAGDISVGEGTLKADGFTNTRAVDIKQGTLENVGTWKAGADVTVSTGGLKVSSGMVDVSAHTFKVDATVSGAASPVLHIAAEASLKLDAANIAEKINIDGTLTNATNYIQTGNSGKGSIDIVNHGITTDMLYTDYKKLLTATSTIWGSGTLGLDGVDYDMQGATLDDLVGGTKVNQGVEAGTGKVTANVSVSHITTAPTGGGPLEVESGGTLGLTGTGDPTDDLTAGVGIENNGGSVVTGAGVVNGDVTNTGTGSYTAQGTKVEGDITAVNGDVVFDAGDNETKDIEITGSGDLIINNNASLEVDTVTMANGDIYAGDPQSKADVSIQELELNSRSLFAEPSWIDGQQFQDADTASAVAIAQFASGIDGNILVGQNSQVALGTADVTTLAKNIKTLGNVWGSAGITAALGLYNPQTLVAGGSVYVDGAATTWDSVNNELRNAAGTVIHNVAANNAVFAANSLLVVDGSAMYDASGKGVAALTATDGTLSVAASAKLHIIGGQNGQTLTIVDGFDKGSIAATTDVAAGGWGNDATMSNLTFGSSAIEAESVSWNEATGTYEVKLKLEFDKATYATWIQGETGNYLTNMVSTVGIAPDATQAGHRFLSQALSSGAPHYLGASNPKLAGVTIEGTAQMGAVANVAKSVMSGGMAAGNAIITHNSAVGLSSTQGEGSGSVTMNNGEITAEIGTNGGNMADKAGLGVWLTPLYKWNTGHGMEGGNFNHDYDMGLGGIALGVDFTNRIDHETAVRFGLAFNVGAGYSDSTGDFNETNNDFNFWGLSLYGAFQKENFVATLDFGFTSTYNDVTQDLPSTMTVGDLEADIDAFAFNAGLNLEYTFNAGMLDITPHAGVRFMSVSTYEYDINSAAGRVATVDDDTQSVWYFPVGVTFSADIESAGGWTFTPKLDVGFIAAAGDLEATSKTRFTGVPGTMELSMDNVDGFAFNGGVGFELSNEESGVSIGLNYNLQAGEKETGHMIFASFRYDF